MRDDPAETDGTRDPIGLLCRNGNWPKKAVVTPRYQQLQKMYTFDDYSYKRAAIIAVKKIHRSLQFEERNEDDDRNEDFASRNNEFGDYNQQIDLEFFNTSTFYQILLKQSLAVSVRLSQHKKEVKTLYQKITKVTESLRELWMERMNFAGSCIVNRTDVEMYEKMCSKVRLEIQRRKDIGQELERILKKQQQLLQADWNSREEHHITFNVALREVVRLLEEHVENRTVLNNPIDQRVYEQVEALLLQMADAITNECQRLSVWSVLGEGTGAQLVKKETLNVLSKEELIGADGAIIDRSLLQVDQLTGLLTPSADAIMILANEHTRPVPGSFFLHPHTGRVLPMNGNICYDSAQSCLLPVTDSGPGAVWESEEHLIPYVPHLLCPETNIPLKLQLANLPCQHDVKLRGPIPDAETGIKVPTLAMTIHLQTGLIHLLGGTCISPVTKMLAPIEIGAPMVCEKTGRIVPIIGVGLNAKTGAVIPLGGVLNSSNNPMILGDSFTEPLSGRSARISGACLHETQLVPHAGGYQALLDGAMLASEVQVLEALKNYKDTLLAQGSEASLLHQKSRATVEDARDGLVRARSRSWGHIIHTMHSLERQRKEAADLADAGGNVGMISFADTGLQIPAVVGMHIPDPGGSDLEVPILGVDYDRSTGRLVPLAGTMEDPDGKGLIPITLGARSIDSITGEIGPVVGARIDPRTRIVVPILQSSGDPMRQNLNGEMLKALEEELHCRREHWRHQRQKENGLFTALKNFLQEVSYCKFTKVEEKVRALGEILGLLQDCAQSEAQRRHVQESNFSSLMPTDVIVLVSQVDKEEVEQQMLLLAAAQTMLEKMKQFTAKMSQDESQLRGQLQKVQEDFYQHSKEASPLGYPQLKSLLTQEFQQNIINQWTCLDMMYIRLEHLRDLAELCGLEAKCVLSGHVYHFGDYQLTRGKNADLFHGSPDVSNWKMIPLIKQLINLLETDRNIILSPGTLNLVSNKEKNWSKMLLKSPLFKLLAEISEHLKAGPEEREVLQIKEDQQWTIQSKVKYQETGKPYMDIMDATCTCEGKLVPLTPEKISVMELAVYRFGNFIAKLVQRVINVPEINLLLASSLPTNNYTHNAFRNSFFYQHSCKTLFIRRQRLASVGDFSLVLVHCLAHLAAGELHDDSNALFLEHFHQALKGIFEGIFFTRFYASPTLRGHEPRDNLFQKDSPEIDMDTISDLLNIRLNDSETTTVFREDGETRKVNGMSTQSKDQQDVKMNECQGEMEKNNGLCLELRSKLDDQEVEEKIGDLSMDLEQKEQDRAMSHPKTRALLREIEELEAELDRREK
ncbi:uncharacterized protein [Narcine bancroftii]|uniref:uncharacterized protein n=1 Tax=Narcine bancroftii TaxID=1343680 RepID=UPI0038317767